MILKFTTPRFAATALAETDLVDVRNLCQDPKVAAWLSADGAIPSDADARQGLERHFQHWQAHGFGAWAFRAKADGRFVGRAGLRRATVEGRDEVELFYAIGSEWWGQGATPEIGLALLGIAFEVIGLDSVVSYTLPHNRASRRVMERLGFTYERSFLHAGLPHVLYRLSRATFRRRAEGLAAADLAAAWLSSAQVRELDRRAAEEHGLSTAVLMENAGAGAAAMLLALGIHGPVVVCCGKGNNGGDGLVLARHLHNAEIDVKVLLCAEPASLSPDAARNWRALEADGVPAEVWPAPDERRLTQELRRAEWIVDALLGVGLQGPARPPLDRVIAAINASPARAFAIDIPSGLDADTGEPHGVAIRAKHTATFVAPKRAFGNPAAATWVGKWRVVDIGVPKSLLFAVLQSA